MKFIKKSLLIISFCCLLLSLSLTCYALVTPVTPKAYGQNKTLWCWATAAKIVGEHNGVEWINTNPVVLSNTDGLHSYSGVAFYGCSETAAFTADGVQRAIVVYVKGSDANHPGTDSDKEAALSYAARICNSIDTFGTHSSSLSSSQIQSIKNDLSNGKYVIGNMEYYSDRGHSVAIKSYNSSTDKYRIQDPWDLTDMYYSSNVFSSNTFPFNGYNCKITWIQYCR